MIFNYIIHAITDNRWLHMIKIGKNDTEHFKGNSIYREIRQKTTLAENVSVRHVKIFLNQFTFVRIFYLCLEYVYF